MIDQVRFEIGDCVILNDCERPCAEMICVVVGFDNQQYTCKYLNADKKFDSYNKPGMKTSLDEATRVADFGVVMRYSDGRYWCEHTAASIAKYRDGHPRLWQESGMAVSPRYVAREAIAKIVWQVGGHREPKEVKR